LKTEVVKNRKNNWKGWGSPVELGEEKGERWGAGKGKRPPPPPIFTHKAAARDAMASRNARSCDLSHWQLITICILTYSTFYASPNNTTKLVPCYKRAICFRYPFQHQGWSLQVTVNGSDKRSDPAVGNQQAQNVGTNSLRQEVERDGVTFTWFLPPTKCPGYVYVSGG